MSEKKKKNSLLARLFGNRNKEVDVMVEEQIQSPGKMMLDNFLHNRLGMTGLIVFILIFIFVSVGPKFVELDLGAADNTQLNVPPTTRFPSPAIISPLFCTMFFATSPVVILPSFWVKLPSILTNAISPPF